MKKGQPYSGMLTPDNRQQTSFKQETSLPVQSEAEAGNEKREKI